MVFKWPLIYIELSQRTGFLSPVYLFDKKWYGPVCKHIPLFRRKALVFSGKPESSLRHWRLWIKSALGPISRHKIINLLFKLVPAVSVIQLGSSAHCLKLSTLTFCWYLSWKILKNLQRPNFCPQLFFSGDRVVVAEGSDFILNWAQVILPPPSLVEPSSLILAQ